jgi:hypothetical protein
MERHVLLLTRANRDKAIRGIDLAIAHGARPDAQPWVLELREAKRSDDQNRAIHGLISQILKQRPYHCGVKQDMGSYKATFMHALGHEMRMLPTLEGDGLFPMGLSTSALTKREFSDLIEYVLAWCAREGLTVEHFDGEGSGGVQQTPSRAA